MHTKTFPPVYKLRVSNEILCSFPTLYCALIKINYQIMANAIV